MPEPELLYPILPSADSTLALEIVRTGLSKRMHFLCFERFHGKLTFDPNRSSWTGLSLQIDARSIICRDKGLKRKQQQVLTHFVRTEALSAETYPEIRFVSNRFIPKLLRGVVAQGTLHFKSAAHPVKVNLVMGEERSGRVQIDGDLTLRLTHLGIRPPSSWFGLIKTNDDVLVRIVMWANAAQSPEAGS